MSLTQKDISNLEFIFHMVLLYFLANSLIKIVFRYFSIQLRVLYKKSLYRH